MGMKFHPAPGTILLCHFEPGFKKPEMIKRRPVVVVSPRLRHRNDLCTVVPLSTREPDKICDYHCHMKMARALPAPWDSPEMWVKADMLATVAFHRLHLIGAGRHPGGNRKYLNIQVETEQLHAIRQCVLHALGLSHLTESL